jgi:hypothetical protein
MAELTHRTHQTRIVTAATTVALVLLFAAILPPCLAAQSPSPGFPGMTPDPMAANFARRGAAGDYSWEDLAEIALWASAVGTAPAANAAAQNTTAYMTTLRQAVAELRASGEMQGAVRDAAAAGDYILTYMHRKFLKSYSTLQTQLDTLLGNGRYNCVSSAVLYLILAQSQGLAVQGVITRDHAFATVYQGDASWDVETTNPYGFDPGNRREFLDQFGKATGFAYVPARNYRDRTSVSPLELISLILSNRIAELESRRRYAEAVPLALNRAALLAGRQYPGGFFTDPRKDLRDRVLNYGASLLNAGKEEDGLRWAAYAETAFLQADGQGDSRWQEYINVLVNNRVAKLCRARRFEEARSFLTENQTLLDPAAYRSLEIQVTDGELVTLVSGIKQAGDTADVIARLDRAEAAGLLPATRARELRDNISRWRVADYHNRFATAFNRRDYSLARSILDEALAEFPGDRQLGADRTTLNRATEG